MTAFRNINTGSDQNALYALTNWRPMAPC